MKPVEKVILKRRKLDSES